MATTLFTENFDTDSNYTTNFGSQGIGNANDFIDVVEGTGPNNGTGVQSVFYNLFANPDGNFFAAQDVDASGATPTTAGVYTITFENINISNATNLMFSGLFASEDNGGNSWDRNDQDEVLVEYSVDGGSYTSLLQFASDAPNGGLPREDTDFDGTGDGDALTTTFTEFQKSIAATGNELDLRITLNSINGGPENIALDSLKITGDMPPVTPPVTPPTPPVSASPSEQPVLTLGLSAQLSAAGIGKPVNVFPFLVGSINLANIFDESHYLANNPDVANAVKSGSLESGYLHFVTVGLTEGRSPFRFYDEKFYLTNNADVAAAVKSGGFDSGLQHFLLTGHLEKRDPSANFDDDDYLLQNPDVNNAVKSGAVGSAFEHFANRGLAEGRLSNVLLFDERYYLANNAEVAQAVQNSDFASGLEHYLAFGQREGRNPSASFNEANYLSLHSDVAAAVNAGAFASGFDHYVTVGMDENRAI